MNREHMKCLRKKILCCFFFLLFFSFLFTGCSDMVEIEDRDFVQALGIAVSQGELKVSYGLPDVSALTGQPAMKGDKLFVSFSGKNFNDIEEQYGYNSEKKLDYNHLQAIIFEASAIQNPQYMKNVLLYIEENYDIARNTKAFVTTSLVEDVLKLDETMSGSVGDYLESYYKNNRSKHLKEECTIGDLITAMNNKDQVIHIPILTIQNKRFKVDGIGIFDGETCECKEYMSEEESKYLYLADGKVKEISVALADGYAIRINDVKTKYTYSLKNNIPYIHLDLNGEAKLVDYDVNVTNISDKSKRLNKTMIEKQVNNQIKNILNGYFKSYVKDKNIDFLNLYRESGIRSRTIWLRYRNNQKAFLEDADFNVGVKIDLDHNIFDK
ncbi:Ger(x)C family spore germination protein [Anaeromicropila herbilytica]|uniref:Germination protein, Ger(X)C family n=1 Tax=Anaeromicropila herbilytica TaxID=2785025 RepID=A0A7R7EHI9_9FIRM|nr:Ger(x)C family spore germination C-terminal domain-containing protein [Anaeromicropila herbilytica]BCN28814.1 hypothetical protein bsdtb5_01090 [Anaeromicropila herbilytica]